MINSRKKLIVSLITTATLVFSLCSAAQAQGVTAKSSWWWSVTPEERLGKRLSWSRNTFWMSPNVSSAWRQGYLGQGTTITVIDTYSGNQNSGLLDWRWQKKTHGGWTSTMASRVAPLAQIQKHDWSAGAVSLNQDNLNVLNLSYSANATAGLRTDLLGNSLLSRDGSIISHAQNGRAVVVKAAGNDSVAVDGVDNGTQDYLNLGLVGAKTAIFVGALDRNGSWWNRASLASYSNFAGQNQQIQEQFLTVGVADSYTGLAGTSFAAPIVSGYAAILADKFTDSSPSAIVDRLLDTARTNTISGYTPSLHGQGEASLSRALAPRSIR